MRQNCNSGMEKGGGGAELIYTYYYSKPSLVTLKNNPNPNKQYVILIHLYCRRVVELIAVHHPSREYISS